MIKTIQKLSRGAVFTFIDHQKKYRLVSASSSGLGWYDVKYRKLGAANRLIYKMTVPAFMKVRVN